MRHASQSLDDTIVACATPAGEGAIAVVRLSGPQALGIGRSLTGLGALPGHRLTRARLRAGDGAALDDALVVEMHAPASYTGEDVVELHLHGSSSVVEGVLAACQSSGARLAGPGEFTLRAFLYGRIDLAQAEAVADLIASKSAAERSAALAQLEGGLSRRIGGCAQQLEDVLARWRAVLDFPEHPSGVGLEPEHLEKLRGVYCVLQELIGCSRQDFFQARRVAVCGAPNVGKSSLINLWAGEERALVDAEPGTTRDPVPVELCDGATRWSAYDTAGLRDGAVGLEARGMQLSMREAQRAHALLWLVDPLRPTWPPDELRARPLTVVFGKADLVVGAAERAAAQEETRTRGLVAWGWVSTHSGEGVAALRAHMAGLLAGAQASAGEVVVTRRRHVEALQRAQQALGDACQGIVDGVTLDVLSMELERALRALGEILGRDVDQAVLERIFSEFCIGK